MTKNVLSIKVHTMYKLTTFTCGILILLVLGAEASASPKESNEPIRIITNNWSSQIVLSTILGEIYSRRGYIVEYVELTSQEQWGRLHRGHEHVQVEVWEGTMKEDFERVSKFGNLLDAGDHNAKTREEWWYPSYVEKTCPLQADSGCLGLYNI
jgi:glycine betaine/proline transport system substrate-binding protein